MITTARASSPSRPDRGSARMLRTVVFAVVAMGLAVLAHSTAAGGARPGITAVTLGAVPVMGVALVLTARRCRFAVVVAGLGTLQLFLHWLFSVVPDPGIFPPPLPHPTHHQHAVARLADTGWNGADPAVHVHAATTPSMLALHVVATLLTAWFLAHGERMLWDAVQRLRCRRLPQVEPVDIARQGPAVSSPPTWGGRVDCGALRVRGPPKVSFSA